MGAHMKSVMIAIAALLPLVAVAQGTNSSSVTPGLRGQLFASFCCLSASNESDVFNTCLEKSSGSSADDCIMSEGTWCTFERDESASLVQMEEFVEEPDENSTAEVDAAAETENQSGLELEAMWWRRGRARRVVRRTCRRRSRRQCRWVTLHPGVRRSICKAVNVCR